MDAPVVHFSSRTRLIRDFMIDDEYDNISQPRGRDFEGQNDLPGPRLQDNLPSPRLQDNSIIPRRTYSLGKRPEHLTNVEPRSNSSLGARSPARSPLTDTNGQFDGQRESKSNVNHDQMEAIRQLDFSLDSIDEQSVEDSSYAPSIASSHVSQVSSQTVISGSLGSSRMPDFFSSEVFQTVLHNPTTAHQLRLYSESRLCGENMAFLENVEKHRMLLNDVAKVMFEIHRDFISPRAANQINISDQLLTKVNKDLKTSLAATLPKLESVFVDSQNEVERLLSFDIYPRFVKHQMSKSAARALSGNRGKYAGLGDCFVLTDPAKADQPIVFASDGFVQVTGYARNEIIPRNCRFLQCRQTDKSAVRRLRNAIDKQQESVEILLNQTKDGKPFWNLLYTTPLFDARGKVVFFLGGQINCSTAINSQSDILRVLAISDEDEEQAADAQAAQNAAAANRGKSGLFSAFRSNSKPNLNQPPRAAGMENNLIGKMEKMDLKTQMSEFHSAYSKFLVVNYSTMFIAFHSAGMIDLLYPARSPGSTQVIGTDIFKFFANHNNGSLSRDFKSRVKSSLKAGQAITLELSLCTRRYMGFEKFGVHFTPLKSEKGEVTWIVVTLGSETGR